MMLIPRKFLVFLFITAFVLFGCRTPEEHKKNTDEQVYDIIDNKWEDDFGPQVNYKISDTQPEPNSIKIEKVLPESGILDIPTAVGFATAFNRSYQLERENLYVQALDLRLIRHNYANQFFGITGGGYSQDGDDQAIGTDGSFGFNRLLPSGTRIGAGLSMASVDILSGNLRGGLSSILDITASVPLMRGSGQDIVMEELTQTERDTLYQMRSFARFRQEFVVSIIAEYYRVVQLKDYAQKARENYRSLNSIYQQAVDLAEYGRLPKYELDQARQSKLDARNTAISAENKYEEALDDFKFTLSLPANIRFELDIEELEALAEKGIKIPDFREQEVIKTALNHRLDLANKIDAVDDAYRKTIITADMLRPDLNLLVSASPVSRTQGDWRTLETQRSEYLADIELSFPLDRVAEQNAYRKALITYNQRLREQEQRTDRVILEVRQSLRAFQEAAELYENHKEALELAEERLANTMELLRYRRADIRDVLDAREDLFDASNEVTEALVNYTIAMLNFYRDTGIIQIKADGMWNIQQSLL